MDWINEFGFDPGPYQHYKGSIYVAYDIITHMDGEQGKMDPLPDPLVVYRDLETVVKHVNGKPMKPHMRYARKLSEFTAMVDHNGTMVKRFTKL